METSQIVCAVVGVLPLDHYIVGMMAFKPQQKQQNQYKTPYIPSAKKIAEEVCTTMGTQLVKGFENRLGDLEQRLQKMARAKKKPGPWKKKPDGDKKKPPPKASPKSDGAKQKPDAGSGNVEGLPKDSQPSRQPDDKQTSG